MKRIVDLHAHSGYSGGVGRIRLPQVAETLRAKGIHWFGTGDCLHPDWLTHLKQALREEEPGLFSLTESKSPVRFILQSELVLTAPLVPNGRRRKAVHIVVLFPDVASVHKAISLLERFQVRNTIGRPFVRLAGPREVARFLFALEEIHPDILWFPAHVMTPDGILGARTPVDTMEAFFGDAARHVRLVETGLSADPDMLLRIPELACLPFISNSDAHSAAPHRIGRECTMIQLPEPSFPALRKGLTGGGIRFLLEFPPQEGKYYATGHRRGRPGHPEAGRIEDDTRATTCPECGRPFQSGVRSRVAHLARVQPISSENRASQQFRHILPLTEVLAAAIGVRSPVSRRVMAFYNRVLDRTGTEIAFWMMETEDVRDRLESALPSPIVNTLLDVHLGRYVFDPPGHDGQYGRLRIGFADEANPLN